MRVSKNGRYFSKVSYIVSFGNVASGVLGAVPARIVLGIDRIICYCIYITGEMLRGGEVGMDK